MSKAVLFDANRCIACRGCQVALLVIFLAHRFLPIVNHEQQLEVKT